ncbi:MAG: diguanylate cyclase [Oscillospiraceae bacterium]|nr:diguanylate cyclase [Oscillospiraceae bacterium]
MLGRKFAAELQAINDLIRKPYVISASLGSVVIAAEEDDSLYGIIKQADEKMYEIKRQKKRARKSEKL